MDPREALEVVARLIARALSAGGKWPLPAEEQTLRWINTWAAIYDNDADQLKRVAQWDGKRPYKVDALGERIADAWAYYLFGEAPTIKPTNDADLGNYSELVRLNRLQDELQRAAALCVAEGEIWPRIFVDPLIADRPLLDWVSRASIFPLWVGPRLAAAAVVTVLEAPPNAAKGLIYRHFEVHAPGLVANLLFQGTEDKIGELRPLEDHPDLAELNTDGMDLAAVDGIGAGRAWVHGLPGLLIGRVANRVKRRRTIGISDYAGILDDLLDLNEAKAIGSSNMRLSARRRVVLSAAVAARAARRTGGIDGAGELAPEENIGGDLPGVKWDPAEEVFVEEPLDRELGKDAKDPVRVIDYSFDAAPLIEWKRDIVETALSRVGMTPQYVGAASASPDGYAISGTALRLRLIPTDAAGRGKGGAWDAAAPTILRTMAMVDALPAAAGGLGHNYADLSPPAFTRKPGLPEDEGEETEKHARRVGAGIESVETAVRDLHPDWEDGAVDEEVARIAEDRKAAAGAGGIPAGF